MKKTINFLSMLIMMMTLCMVFVACSSSDDDDNGSTTPALLIGTWRTITPNSPFGVLFFGEGKMRYSLYNTPNSFLKEVSYTYDAKTATIDNDIKVLKLTQDYLSIEYSGETSEYYRMSNSPTFSDQLFDKEYSELIVGQWKCEISYKNHTGSSLEEGWYMKINMSFSEDGTVTLDECKYMKQNVDTREQWNSCEGTWVLSHGILTISAGGSILSGDFHVLGADTRSFFTKHNNDDIFFDKI